MAHQFTDDDVGKTVVNDQGDDVGIVSDVEHGTAHVEPDPGITDTIKAKLGWGGTDDDTYPLQENAVSRVTDDEIRLQSDLSGAGTGTGATGSEMGTESRTTDTGRTDTGTTDRGTDDDLMGDDDDGILDDDDSMMGDDTDRR